MQNNVEDKFTVDKTAPKNLRISYSQNVFQNVLNSITFGYYNAPVTVTISAEDDTTAIGKFVYSYLKDNNSTNHSYINGSVVQGNQETELFDGAVVTLSNEDFEFHID